MVLGNRLDDKSIHSLWILVNLLCLRGRTIPHPNPQLRVWMDKCYGDDRKHPLPLRDYLLFFHRHEQLVPAWHPRSD